MFHNFDEACRHEEICSKEHPVVVSGNRAGDRSVGRVGTAAKPAAGADMEVTDTINNYDDIVTTVSYRQNTARGRAGAKGKARDKSMGRKGWYVVVAITVVGLRDILSCPKKGESKLEDLQE